MQTPAVKIFKKDQKIGCDLNGSERQWNVKYSYSYIHKYTSSNAEKGQPWGTVYGRNKEFIKLILVVPKYYFEKKGNH